MSKDNAKQQTTEMTKVEQIEIISNLIDGVEELDGEVQSGWEDVIEAGQRLLTYIKNKDE